MWHATSSSNNYHQRLYVRPFLDQLFHGLTDVFLSKIQYRINNFTHRQSPFELSICILSWCSCFEILCLVISWKIWHFNVEMLQFCIQRKITLSLSLSLSIAPIIYIWAMRLEKGWHLSSISCSMSLSLTIIHIWTSFYVEDEVKRHLLSKWRCYSTIFTFDQSDNNIS